MSRIPIEWVDRYIAGTSSPEESATVKKWLAEAPEHRVVLEALQEGAHDPSLSEYASAQPFISQVDGYEYRPSEADFSRVNLQAAQSETESWSRIQQRINIRSRTSDSIRVPIGNRNWTVFRRAIVSTICVVTIAIVGTLFFKNQNTSPSFHTYTTAAGQRARVGLPDGSSVLLNAGSSIRYSSEFGRTTRDIYLSGEGIFTVAKSEGTPFVVYAGPSVTRVLGTVFSARYYPSDLYAKVVVGEGRVASADSVLSLGDAAIVANDGTVSIRHGVDIASEFAWSTGRLVYYLKPLHEVISDLSRWYGITVHVTDPSLLKREVSTTLQNEDASQAMTLIAAAVKAHAKWSGRIVTLSPEVSR
jgi:transmembrane sensor